MLINYNIFIIKNKTLLIVIPLYGKSFQIVEKTFQSAINFKNKWKEEIEVFCIYENNETYNYDDLVTKYDFDLIKKFTNGSNKIQKVNFAFEKTNAKYAFCLDSDDLLNENAAIELVNVLMNKNFDLLINKLTSITKVNDSKMLETKVVNSIKPWANWNSIYKTSALKQRALSLENTALHIEDQFRNLVTGISGSIGFIKINYYNYFIYKNNENNSITEIAKKQKNKLSEELSQFNNLYNKKILINFDKRDKNIRKLFNFILIRLFTNELWNTKTKYKDFKEIWKYLVFRDRLKYKTLYILNKYLVDYFK